MDESANPPRHPLATLRGEFVWEGKYDADGRRRRARLPERTPVPEPLDGWTANGGGAPGPNRLLSGDNLLALAALLPEQRGRVQLIYIDPPFDTGTDHTMRVPVGDGRRTARLDVVAYRDRWGAGAGSFLQMMDERLRLMRDLLAPGGVLCLHCDWRSNAQLRLLLDEVFGPERFVNEIVWHYYNKYSAGTRCLPRAHDTILMYARGARPALNELRLAREAPQRQLVRENVDGVLRNARDGDGRLRYRTVHDRKGDDVWRIPQLQPASAEWSGYSTQKHHDLLARIIALTTRPGDLVADFFCGAGTTLAVAERMGRRWIGCDLGAMAVHTTRKRLLRARTGTSTAGADDIPSAPPPPFVVASLAADARRLWLEGEHGGDPAALRASVLAAFGAAVGDAADGKAIHGALAGAACALPEVLGDCTAEHARVAAHAAQQAGAGTVYVLAWRFDPRFWLQAGAWQDDAGVQVCPVLIPDALATPHGNAPPVFRALPRVEAAWQPADGARTWALRLLRHSAGPARPAWGDGWQQPPETADDPLALLDGWSVDPAWRPGRPFSHAWWSFRTPRARALAAESAPLRRNGGQPCVLLADVWGVTTRHALDWPAAPPRA